ncbi:hypothetical protein [Nocardioides marmoribigeumensis]|uniref:Uncharacterized protein n=1 Tax=Nocardioides marmoribigeumensis TaxID=433649 RepID=A0ABU2C105_9ACTN|nr:hypothetical protein [Nocardioides marmoribigeumensis]MDR7364316.1 hypothetical protein [Nocardioides marmoribigeumensis]
MSGPAYAPEQDRGEITYEEFGRRLFQQVLHAERIEDSIATVLGDRIELGPFGAGPGRFLAKVRALGTIGRPTATPLPGPMVAYRVDLPIDVAFHLDLAVDVHTFHAALGVPLVLTARAAAPLTIVWDITPPELDQMRVQVQVERRSSELLRRVAGIDEELRRFMRRYVVRELAKEHVERATHIHLGEVIDASWPMIAAVFLEPGPRV